MANEQFETNLLRLIASQLYFSLAMQTSREMFGKSYFSLGVAEQTAVNQAVFANISGNYQALTEEFLKGQVTKSPVGFQQPATPTPKP